MSTERPILRTTAFTAVLVATIVSVGLMLRACRFNDSEVALALIAVWILSPMAALVLAEVVAKRWLIFGRATVHCLMLVVASGSMIIYAIDLFVPLSPRRGFPYALVPAASWLLIAMVLAVAAFRTRARAKNHVAS
jgi:ABC-type Mn2+/Zn2+ transport system permease subunit